MRKFLILPLLCVCLFGCKKQADIQKVYNSGSNISIVSYDVIEFPTESNNYTSGHSNTGYAMVYSKAKETMSFRNALGYNVVFDNIRYNKLVSDDTQICLQSDYVRFVIMNSGESYIVKMYKWQFTEYDWHQIYSFSDCKINANEKYLSPHLENSPADEQAVIDIGQSEVETVETEDYADTYQVVEADSRDGFASIRQKLSSQSAEIGRLPNGEMAAYLSSEGEWFYIDYDGVVGYVHSKCAKIVTLVDP